MNFLYLFLAIFLFATKITAQDPEQMTHDELVQTISVAMEKDDSQMAIFYLEIAIQKAKKDFGGNDSISAMYLNQAAEFYVFSGNQPDKANEYITQALKIRKAIYGKNSSPYVESLTILAFLKESLGDYEKAIPLYQEALNIEKKISNFSPAYLFILDNIVNCYMDIGYYQETEGLLNEAIKNSSAKDTRGYFSLINNLAHLYQKMGRYNESELVFQQTLDLAKKIYGTEHPYYARTLNNFGNLCNAMKNYKKAHLLITETLKLSESLFGINHPNYIATLHNFASLTFEMGAKEEGILLGKKALELEKKIMGENSFRYIISLNSQSLFYKEVGNFMEAEKLVLKTIEIAEKINKTQHPYYISFLNNAAEIYVNKKDFEKVYQYLKRSILANCTTPDKLEGMDFNAILKEIPQLSFYFDLQLILSLQGVYNSLEEHYLYDKDKSHLETALLALKAGEAIINGIRNSFGHSEDKLGISQYASFFAEKVIKITLALNQPSADAFYYAEINKSILLADATKSQRARNISDLPDSLALQELELEQGLDLLKKQVLEANDETTKSGIVQQINEITLTINDFKKNIKERFPQYHQLKYANITATAEMVQKLLNDKTLLLEFFIADSVVYLFSVAKNNVDLITLKPNKTVLSSKIAVLRKALTNYDFIIQQQSEAYQLYTETAYWFYENLIAPAIKNKTIQNLVIVSDGELGHLPFEVFLSKRAPQAKTPYNQLHYLVKDYNISYNYSATLWKENMENPRKKNNSQILALAAEYSKNSLDSTKLRSNRAPHLLSLRDGLIELPAAQEEVEALSKKFNGSFWGGNDANEQSFKKNATEFGIIHLAMHGILNQNTPILSSLAFTENHDSIDDNFLEAWEIAHLKLNADLVVLSACETGFGKFQQGEGVMSLARSFMYAGVPSLVVSLWQVNDHSTAILMQSFYEYLAGGKLKDEALRQAKLDYLEAANGVAAHPAFWSAFIQLGDNRAIALKQKNSWMGWMIGGLILLIIGVVVMKQKRK